MVGKSTLALGLVLLGVAATMAGHHGHGGGHGDGGGSGGVINVGGGGEGGAEGGHGGGGHGHGWGYADSHPKYSYSYGVKDKHTWDEKMASESRDGDKVKGEYSLKEADGSWRKVTYWADKSGFHAHVHRTPNHHGWGHGGAGGAGGAGVGGSGAGGQ